jgi:hypothetical protein
MVDNARKGLNARGHFMRDLVVRDTMERILIVKGNNKRSPTMMNLITATMMRKWKI